jgi:O-antigen/teichoic acid export membrane protein
VITRLKTTFSSKSDFLKNVVTLMTGTAISQIIPLLATPFLTRLYSPEDFGLLALYLSSVSILAIVVTGNYEKSIIMPKSAIDAIGLIKLALYLISFGCIIILIFTLTLDDTIASFYSNKDIKDLLIFIPFSVFSLALYNVVNTWFNRIKEYRKLSYNRVAKSTISSSLSVGLGFLNLHSLGLIVGEFFGQLLATLLFSRTFYRENKSAYSTIDSKKCLTLAKEYKNFPLYTLPADMLSMASYQLPVFVFSKIFSQTVVGYYSLCIRVLDKPLVFMTSAIYEVFRQKAIEDYNQHGNCLQIFKKTFKRLLLLAIPTMILIFLLSPIAFKIVFGTEWEIAGHYARIISIMYLFKFVASPLSFMFYIVNKQRLDFILHVYVFISSCIALYISYWNSLSVEHTLIVFVINYCFVYSFYLVKSYQFAHGHQSDN